MKLEHQGDTVRISAVKELGTPNASAFRDWVLGAFEVPQKNIEIDLSGTTFLDSTGLGALVSLYKRAKSRKGTLRLLRPQPQALQFLELTRMNQIFEIIED